MKQSIKNKIIILSAIGNSLLFWSIYYNNIYKLINVYRDIKYFNYYDSNILWFILVIISLLYSFYILVKCILNNKIYIFIIMLLLNVIGYQNPLYFFISNQGLKDSNEMYYSLVDRFSKKEDLLNMELYKKNIKSYYITLNIFKNKTNLMLLDEELQNLYIDMKINIYENKGNEINMEKIYTFNDLEIELNNIKNFKDCKKITTQEMFYFCTKYNIPAEVKYKIYLNNLNFTHIYNKKPFDKKFHQSVILNNFIHYSEALSNVDTNKMTVEEKNKDKEYRNEIKKCLLSMENLNNIIIMKTVDNTIIINSRFGHQSEMFRDPENAPILSIHND